MVDIFKQALAIQPRTVRAAPTMREIPPAFKQDWNTLKCAWKEATTLEKKIVAGDVVDEPTLLKWWGQPRQPNHLITGLFQYETEDMAAPQWPRLLSSVINEVFLRLKVTERLQRTVIRH